VAGTVFLCCTDHRRAALEERLDLNGIDFLEVGNLERADLDSSEQLTFDGLDAAAQHLFVAERKLTVAFVNPLLPAHNAALDDDSLRLDGGERPDSRNIRLTILARTAATLVLRATRRGDFSPYRLSIIESPTHPVPPQGFDPLLAAVDFSFKVDCPSEFDCAPGEVCPPAERPTIDIDYLARDYATFRRLMLDRISALSPNWRERHAADLGVALVELVSYVADHLAYRQESIGTEAYLRTARKRVSVRRHARLVDYAMHDGCNARAWIQVLLDKNVPPAGITLTRTDPVTQRPIRFLTGLDAAGALDPAQADALLIERHPEVFEPLHDVTVYPAHDRFDFYTWGASECCLPKGATRATLRGHFADLVPNMPLLLEEVAGAETGRRADRDPSHRHVVRLTRVEPGVDPLGGRFDDHPNDGSVDITEIQWDQDDALPFPLCVTAPTPGEDGVTMPTVIGVAGGNLVLADHGMTIGPEPLGTVPDSVLTAVGAASAACAPAMPVKIPMRYRPELARGPLAQAGRVVKTEVRNGRTSTSVIPFDPEAPASHATRWAMPDVVPEIELTSTAASSESTWHSRRDLLSSAANALEFVVECESDGTARVRFGDGRLGSRPPAGTSFEARYRVGNGARGNVGAEAIAHVARTGDGVVGVRNPLAASGGVDAESIEDVRRFAPVAFRTQQRAVTTDDYARRAELHPQVQKAAATFRWTGSWRTVYVTADPRGGPLAVGSLDPGLPVHLEPFRMAGHDLDIDVPRYVPLEIDMQVCAKPDYFRSGVKQALLDLFGSRRLPDGRTGIFHPDNFTFGQPLYLSRLYAAAFQVEGVESVTISTFQRQGVADPAGLETGRLTFARLEIAQLDNDRDFPERGVLRLTVEGGK
jgi:hypothetical protein